MGSPAAAAKSIDLKEGNDRLGSRGMRVFRRSETEGAPPQLGSRNAPNQGGRPARVPKDSVKLPGLFPFDALVASGFSKVGISVPPDGRASYMPLGTDFDPMRKRDRSYRFSNGFCLTRGGFASGGFDRSGRRHFPILESSVPHLGVSVFRHDSPGVSLNFCNQSRAALSR